MDYEELIELLVIDLLLVGNAYWFKWRTNEKGQPLALYRLAPPFVKGDPRRTSAPRGYEYTVPGSGQRKPLQIPLSDMIHFKLPNPHSPYYGLGIVQGGGRPLDLELALTDHQASYYEKGTNPSMIVQSDRRVPKDVFKKLQMQLRNRYGGPRHAGELMVLEAGLKATTITPNAMEAAFASSASCRATACSPCSACRRSCSASATRRAATTSRPTSSACSTPRRCSRSWRSSSGGSRALTQAWDVDFVIDYRYQMPKEDQVKLAGDFSKIPGVTVREVREFLELPPTGDDSIDDLVLNLPGDNGVPGATREGFPDQPLPGEGGRPPNGNNTTAFGTVGGGNRPDLVAGSRARRPSEKGARGKSLDEIQARLDELAGKAVTLQTPKPASTGRYLDSADVPDLIADERMSEIDALTATTVAEIRDAVPRWSAGCSTTSKARR